MFDYRIRFSREKKDIKQIDAAKALKINKTTYCNYESEKYIVPLKHLNEISNLYEVSLDYLFGFTNIPNYTKYKKEYDIKIIIQRLKEFRKENNLTQKSLSQILEIGEGTYAEYETGRYLISTHILYTICKKYKVSADYLLGKIDSPKYINKK